MKAVLAVSSAAALLMTTSLTQPAEAKRGFGAGVAIGVIVGGALGAAAASGKRSRSKRRSRRARPSKTNRYRSNASRRQGRARNGSRSVIRDLKSALLTLGLFAGTVNAADDPSYRQAIRNFQRSRNLAETGQLDDTQKELLLQEVEARKQLVALGPADGQFFGDNNKRVQTGLQVLGFYNGKIDGKIGGGTKRSVRAYQRSKQRAATGVLTPPEIDQLALDARTLANAKIAGINQQFVALASHQGGKLPVAPNVPGQALPSSGATQLKPAQIAPAASAAIGKFAAIAPIKPDAAVTRPYDVAVIIGNSDYKNPDIPDVKYGVRDAQAVKSLLINDLGFSQDNVIDARDAGQAKLTEIFGSKGNNKGKVWRLIDPDGKSNVYVFYSGHGAPEVSSRTPYLMPVDASPDTIALNGYPLEQMYGNLDSLKVKSVSVFIDACFSGGSSAGMLTKNASPVAVTAKMPAATKRSKRLMVLAAADGDQLASWDDKKGFGMFTQNLVRGLRGEADASGDGKVTAAELHKYVYNNVRKSARREYGRIQTPVLMGNANQVLR